MSDTIPIHVITLNKQAVAWTFRGALPLVKVKNMFPRHLQYGELVKTKNRFWEGGTIYTNIYIYNMYIYIYTYYLSLRGCFRANPSKQSCAIPARARIIIQI